ncbi:hypothetical protein [Acinetobacter sp.]|uniref:hypothetical protein n=1 Tax=Acinetobacter sp. TaxID=472 RepID=UPI003FA57C46
MAESKPIEPKALQFKANPFEIGTATENQKRKFSGVAYSGEPIQGITTGAMSSLIWNQCKLTRLLQHCWTMTLGAV